MLRRYRHVKNSGKSLKSSRLGRKMIKAKMAQLEAKRIIRKLGVRKAMPKLLKASDYSFTNRDRGDVEKCVSLGIRIARKARRKDAKVFYIQVMWEWFVFLATNESEVMDRVEAITHELKPSHPPRSPRTY